MKIPVVSVIVPVYNTESFIAEAIESILNQTYSDFELIIIDDYSTDSTREIINKYTDPRINFVSKSTHTGLVSSLNLGIALSKGEFIARMDGDDVSCLTRFEKQVNFLKANPNIALCGTWFQLLSTQEIIKYPLEPENIKIALLDYCPFGHPTVMFRRDFITVNNIRYNEEYKSAEDYELWTRIVAIGKSVNIPEPLLSYRLHENQITIKDQYNQVKNSNLCRIKMMCYPLGDLSDLDIKTSSLLVQNEKINDIIKLSEVVDWLDRLYNLNKETCFYSTNEFKKYIKNKKSVIIRRFFLNTSSYNPLILYHFSQSKNNFQGYFTTNEYIKLVIKCLVFWKSSL